MSSGTCDFLLSCFLFRRTSNKKGLGSLVILHAAPKEVKMMGMAASVREGRHPE